MSAFSIPKAAAALLEARRFRSAIALPGSGPSSAAEAFAVQDAVAASLGPAGAWKVGTGGEAAPFTAAPIAAWLCRASPGVFGAGDFLRVGVEAEIAFRLGRDLGVDGHAPAEDEVRAAVVSLHAALEIVDSRFDTWPVPDPLWALADNQNNGGFVYTVPGVTWDGASLAEREATLVVNGDTVFSGLGRNPGGDPWALLQWLAGHAVARGGLRAGTLVTTGSLTGLVFVQPGAEVVAEIAGIGRVEVSLPA
ncbi:fumarylacetoacetate hydrolase family protein [Enterovirga sp.]|uniref:2-keto-4-pentenoate hydratase n=1 Tax=Enterovirga sp. TaxID=2026350 RepID=UPI00261E52D3|nr:fumarylacetoacetate hydrolase family protein [Enterovirga sp.]MDB5591831.1 mhpD 2 [Enterovirga sp.]